MTSTSQLAIFIALIVSSASLKTDITVEVRNGVMLEALHANEARLESLNSKAELPSDAFEVVVAMQTTLWEQLAGLARGGLLLVVLSVLGLYVVKDQPVKKHCQKASWYTAGASEKTATVPVQVPSQSNVQIEKDLDKYVDPVQIFSQSQEEMEQDLDKLLEQQHPNRDSDEDAVSKMLESSLDAEVDAACERHHAEEGRPLPSRSEIEATEIINQELERYLDLQHADEHHLADLVVLQKEMDKMLLDSFEFDHMLDASLEAEAEAAMVIHNTKEEVDVSRVEMEIQEQLSESLGFSQVPTWM